MNEFDYSDNMNSSSDSEHENDTVTPNTDTENGGADEKTPVTYSVSYGPSNFDESDAKSSKNKKRSLKVALIAAAVVVAMGLSTLAGYFGTMLAGTRSEKDAGTPEPGTNMSIADADNETSDENTQTADKGDGISATISKNDGTYPKINSDSSITDVVAAIRDSVVEIRVTVKSNGMFGQTTNTGAGSGVIIAPEGYIVTNHHVIDGASSISVRLTNGKEYDAELKGTHAAADIAVIKIAPEEALAVAELGSSSGLLLGEEVIAIGNPLGLLGGTVTRGIVSGLERTVSMEDGNYMKLLQTDAAINPGNSGGGLFDLGGKLIGIVNAKYADEDIEGLGFAIPIDYAYDIINDLIDNGYVKGVIDHGLSLIEVGNSAYAQAYFGTRKTGVFITDSLYSTDLEYGDRIVSINGKSVSTLDDVTLAFNGLKVGDTVTVEFERSGARGSAKIELREYVPDYIK